MPKTSDDEPAAGEDSPDVRPHASRDGRDPALVVGIGASAGGLDAFRTLFGAMPADSGMAFIVVQHLDPRSASTLPEILARSTTMPVASVVDGEAVVADRIYVIPPDAVLTISAGVLRLARPASAMARRVGVDTFLTSLAADQGPKAVGVILAGFGSDGALGVEAVKENGGLTISQAEFDHAPLAGMPQSATAGGFVDHVLPVEKIPAALLDHLRYRAATGASVGEDGVRHDVANQLPAICAILNSRLGRDFSHYKSNTLMRRVQRRMQILQITETPRYVQELRERPEEAELLFREVLVRVTQFFRDPDAFDAFAARIPDLLAHSDAQDPVRIWVPGCATGEEAYSLAILFKEAIARLERPRKVLIFATDIDDQAIEIARAGLYPEAAVKDLPEALLSRHFVKEVDRFRVSKDIRQMCLFSTHDLVKDPPFSRLDAISCRNVMIYFGAALQKRVVTMFHYGLRPGGVLLLGMSEAVTAHARLFAPVDKKHRLFERRDGRGQVALGPRTAARAAPEPAAARDIERERDPRIAQVMARYTPAHVVTDRRHTVVQFSGNVAKYLDPTIDASNLKLLGLVRAPLRSPLRAALQQAASTLQRVVQEGLALEVSGRREGVTLIVEPLPDSGTGEAAFVVAFQDLGPIRAPEAAVAPDGAPDEDLAIARERLQTLTEELETANEELQSSNEEYQSVNEELQSLNEELETSKEELQSLNEELATVNAELNVRNESLVDINSDLRNLIDSTAIATLFLDEELRIKRFTPAILDLFNVREGDEGRPITDIVSRLARDGLGQDAQQVFKTLTPVTREVSLIGGARTFQMTVRPYRDLNNAITGVVVTFTDITERKRSEADRASLAAIVDSSRDAIIGHDVEGQIVSWNAAAERIFGYAAEEVLGLPMNALLDANQAQAWPSLLARLVAGETIPHFDTTRTTKGGRTVDVSMTLSPIRDTSGAVVGVSAIGRDITERKEAEGRAQLLLSELDHRVKNILAVISAIVGQTLKTEAPESLAEVLEQRIRAISQAHSQLTSEGGQGASLGAIIRTELEPYDDRSGRISVAGPTLVLTPKASFALAMAVHELTTNAAKYGALSRPEGRLSVRWERVAAPTPALRLTWTERGGPPVEPPTRRGFGTTLIERTLDYEFDAHVERAFDPEGLQCTILAPLTEELGRLEGGPER